MATYDSATYGDRIAAIYDELYPASAGSDAAAERLHDLAEGGPILELGIGTGRIAIPLAARGAVIAGVDASAAMTEHLRAKPGGDAIPVEIGDFSSVPLGGPYQLVFVAFNTLFALPDQESQLRCFANVAAALAPDGRFVVEAFVPDLGRFDRGQRMSTELIGVDVVHLESAMHDAANQRVDAAHIVITAAGTEIYPVQIRYAWPAELDLMARLAGLTLEHRWGSWHREPFTSTSNAHVSVWRLG
ncbi:MAG: class I SAM-dependent methyltransferase [Acidimicrobiia bacterium]